MGIFGQSTPFDADIASNMEITGKAIEISFFDIVQYFEGVKRSIKEGDEIVKAGWVYAIGLSPPPSINQVTGIVVAVSSIVSKPHEVKIENIYKDYRSWVCTCSCKAGSGRKCKHIAACLIHMHKNPYLEIISCTEISQKWGKLGKQFANKFCSIDATDLCHCRKQIKVFEDVVSQDLQEEIFKDLLAAKPDCEISRYFLQNSSQPNEIEEEEVSEAPCQANDNSRPTEEQYETHEFFKLITASDGLGQFVPLLNTFSSPQNSQGLSRVKKSKAEISTICQSTVSQNSALWLVERKLRITGSIAYKLFTYSSNKNPDWPAKLKSTYESSFKGNNATRYGQQAEKRAKKVYGKKYCLFEVGLVISFNLPFLAVSPDGVAFDGESFRLVEIKSPVKGKDVSAENLLSELNFLCMENGKHTLKKRHPYYGQVQLGLVVLNLEFCDFVIFSSFDNSYKVIQIHKDDEFIKVYIESLCHIYFEQIIPFLQNY